MDERSERVARRFEIPLLVAALLVIPLHEWDGVWRAIETMTTAGYGDINPSTTAGGAIAIVVMIVGVGFATLLIGSVAERFIAHEGDAELEVTEAQLRHERREVQRRLERVELLLSRRR